MWAVAGLSAFLVFPLAFGTEHLIHLPRSYGTQAASSSKKSLFKGSNKQAIKYLSLYSFCSPKIINSCVFKDKCIWVFCFFRFLI